MKNRKNLAVHTATTAALLPMKVKYLKFTKMLLFAAFFILHSSFFISCKEDNDTVDEYANWQQRNEQFFATLEDSLASNPGTWTKFKSYSKDQSLAVGYNTDCIYVKQFAPLDKDEYNLGDTTTFPMGTDSVRVSYEGRLIPSATYPQGYVFDTRAYQGFNAGTSATSKLVLSGSLVDGFTTALLHMHRGDHWLVYIPYQLGYNSSSQTGIPAFSTLIFDLVLIDFSPVGQTMPVWNARQSTTY